MCAAAAVSGRAASGRDGGPGHSQLAITMDIYGHVMATALRDAASGMGRALGGD